MAASTTLKRRFGKIVNRNAAVSRSITIRSTKFAVICTTSCLSRDSSTSSTTSVSDSAPDSAGRRSSAIQKKFKMPQDNRKPVREPKSVSVENIKASAASCGAATADSLARPTDAGPAEAVVTVGPGFGADAMDVGRLAAPGFRFDALTGGGQETDAAPGSSSAS